MFSLGATFYGENPGPGLHEQKLKNGRYLVYLPAGYSQIARYPLVILSHSDPDGNATVDPQALMKSWVALADARGYIIALPLAGGVFFAIDEWYLEALEMIKSYYAADPRRVLVTGFGTGGHYALHLGVTYPGEFTAVSPVAGTFEGWWKGLMKFKGGNRPKFYFLAGANDSRVPPSKVKAAADEMRQKGYSAEFEELANLGHAYSDEMTVKIADWFDGLKKRG